MAWLDNKGESHALEYTEVCDGQFHHYSVEEFADEIGLSLTRPDVLEATARKNGEVLLSAKREVISTILWQVPMSGMKPDGTAYNTISWYAKDSNQHTA